MVHGLAHRMGSARAKMRRRGRPIGERKSISRSKRMYAGSPQRSMQARKAGYASRRMR